MLGIRTSKDLPYGDHQRQRLDIYSPSVVGSETPIIVFFHGGAWSSGDKAALSSQGESFAGAGVIFVAANYRLFPDVAFPDFVYDAAAAVAFTLNSFNREGAESRPLFVSGWSAGAYNAALLAYDHRYLAEYKVAPGAVTGVIGLSGPYEGGYCSGIRCEHIFQRTFAATGRFREK